MCQLRLFSPLSAKLQTMLVCRPPLGSRGSLCLGSQGSLWLNRCCDPSSFVLQIPDLARSALAAGVRHLYE